MADVSSRPSAEVEMALLGSSGESRRGVSNQKEKKKLRRNVQNRQIDVFITEK